MPKTPSVFRVSCASLHDRIRKLQVLQGKLQSQMTLSSCLKPREAGIKYTRDLQDFWINNRIASP